MVGFFFDAQMKGFVEHVGFCEVAIPEPPKSTS